MKTLTLLFVLFFAVPPPVSVYQFKVASIEGKPIDLKKYKGKKILIVNTASKCGYTPQYTELEALYQKYKGKLVIIGFPANNFGGQEPGTNAEIMEFCTKDKGVTFPMSSKISVKGDDIDPIFKYLTTAENAEHITGDISWNFEKFLIDENGVLIHRFKSKVTPMSAELTKYL